MKITDMTLEEKILQTLVIRVNKDQFNPLKVGAAFFFGEIITEADEMGLEAARRTLSQYVDNADIPILITSDFENGCGSMLKGLTPLPYMSGLGATNSEEIAYNYGKATALEGRSVGANWSFSPVSDLLINNRNPLVNVRAISDDPDLACRLLRQVVRGMQDNGLAACAKHFPGDGMDYRDQHIVTTNNTLSYAEWQKYHGRVFAELIDEGVDSIMIGHITLPDYQKKVFENGMKLPATLSDELVTNLLKKEMGFRGVAVTDALGMGGFNGWYKDARTSAIESFRAGNDMMLWPDSHYVEDMKEAVENGYVSMERLDDAVTRILEMKDKLGLFDKDNHPITLSAEDRAFVKKTMEDTAENSVTLIRDKGHKFPLDPAKTKKIIVVPVCQHAPTYVQGENLCRALEEKGFEVLYKKDKAPTQEEADGADLILYALFSRSFRPQGFLDFLAPESTKIARSLCSDVDKTIVVSFGSPYFGQQYFERAETYVNAYSMVECSVRAFVRAAVGEIPFTKFSPFKLDKDFLRLYQD